MVSFLCRRNSSVSHLSDFDAYKEYASLYCSFQRKNSDDTNGWQAKHDSYIGQVRETLTFRALLYLNVAVHEVCRLFCAVYKKIRRYSARLSRIIVLLFNKLITKLVTFLNLSVDIFSLHFFFPRTKLRYRRISVTYG